MSKFGTTTTLAPAGTHPLSTGGGRGGNYVMRGLAYLVKKGL